MEMKVLKLRKVMNMMNRPEWRTQLTTSPWEKKTLGKGTMLKMFNLWWLIFLKMAHWSVEQGDLVDVSIPMRLPLEDPTHFMDDMIHGFSHLIVARCTYMIHIYHCP